MIKFITSRIFLQGRLEKFLQKKINDAGQKSRFLHFLKNVTGISERKIKPFISPILKLPIR